MKEEDNRITTALLMAAGMGKRIRPLSEDCPKPLIKVHGRPMIETIIDALNTVGIERIVITVGYKKEKYFYLQDKYGNITFIENTEYQDKNTISSFYAAMDAIDGENCMICESDLFIADPLIFCGKIDKSRYYLREVMPQNYEWGFDLSEGRVKKVVRPTPEKFLDHHMYGIAYWMRDDLKKLIDAVKVAYQEPSHKNKAYDEIANEIFDEIDMGIIKVTDGQVYEIDCVEDLVKVDPSYRTLISEK